jgi:hypothetical protein
MAVDGLPSKHLPEKEIELQFKQYFGHSRTFAAIQAKLYEVGAGKLRRKKKNIVTIKSALLQPLTRPDR